MKRTLAFSIFLVFLCCSLPASADDYLMCFSTHGSTQGVDHLFDGDLFALSLYINSSKLTAYIIETTWNDGKASTLKLNASVKSKVDDNHLYFVLENGFVLMGHYDENGYDFWIDYDAGSVKLHAADEFTLGFDYIGGKYAN